MWKSQDKDKVKSLEPRGAIGRFLGCETWKNGQSWILRTTKEGDLEIIKGLKPKPIVPDMVRMAKPAKVPEGWSPLAVHAIASMWKYVMDPDGTGMWLRLCDGFTQKEATSASVARAIGESNDAASEEELDSEDILDAVDLKLATASAQEETRT